MRTIWIIAKREIKERIYSRSFVITAIIGPLLLLASLYFLFVIGGNEQQKWNVLVSDKVSLFENKILSGKQAEINYSFYSDYIEADEFALNPKYKKYDALVEVNEKILNNKTCFVFYREKPSFNMSVNLRYQVERRLEEVVATEVQKIPLSTIRQIKQPLNLAFKNVYDPQALSSDFAPWVGLGFGVLIVIFVYLFGTSIMRSVSKEKSNRIVEVLLASIPSKDLLLGKIIGIGLSALVQLVFWFIVLGLGLYLFREYIFINQYDPAQVAAGLPSDYNQFVELIYERIQFGTFLFYFTLFMLAAYWFYGSFFASLGASLGSENDGQQFLIPILLLLCFSIYAGYFAVQNPTSPITTFYLYFPFTAPVVAMVKFSQGFTDGNFYQLFVSLGILVLSSILITRLAGKLFKTGLLHNGHSLRLKNIVSWLKQS